MEYDRTQVQLLFQDYGELMFVLESDREYELHTGNVEFEDEQMVAKGFNESTGEYEKVWIPYDTIEHVKTHEAL